MHMASVERAENSQKICQLEAPLKAGAADVGKAICPVFSGPVHNVCLCAELSRSHYFLVRVAQECFGRVWMGGMSVSREHVLHTGDQIDFAPRHLSLSNALRARHIKLLDVLRVRISESSPLPGTSPFVSPLATVALDWSSISLPTLIKEF